MEQWNAIISASVDTSVRVWTLEGNFIGILVASCVVHCVVRGGPDIGTFGQENPWVLGVPMTYQHPFNSRDLLLHTETVSTSPPSSESGQGESGGDEEFSKKPQPRKLRAAVLAVQTALTVTEMEDEVRILLLHVYKDIIVI